MKYLNKLGRLGILTTVLAFVSCSTENEIGTSLITNYADITFEGGDPLLIEQGEPFAETAMATIEGVEVPMETNYVGQYRGNEFETLDTNVADIYTAEYSAVNKEGFVGTVTRQVIVAETGDLVNSIEGLYTCSIFRNGVQPTDKTKPNYNDIEYMLIWKNEDGTYEISDAFGGWYVFGREIPNSETPGGIIVANDIATNNFSFPGTQTNTYFGGTSEITSLIVDPEEKTIVMTTVWQADAETTYTFEAHLKQVQF